MKHQDWDYLINQYLNILEHNFKYQLGDIPLTEVHEMINELEVFFTELIKEIDRIDDKSKWLTRYKKIMEINFRRYMPLLELLIKLDGEKASIYERKLKEAYRWCSRISLEHYMIYREWEENQKFFVPRYEIMQGYIHYLQEIAMNPNFRVLIFNAPSGYGKTYPEKISEAWNFGVDPTGTVLSICSNEDVVKGGSRTVIDEMKSEEFGEVFPNMKWSEDDKNYFLKETEANWKLKDCKLSSSYLAKTSMSNTVGARASQRIHIDDLYPDYREAMNSALNEYYYNTYLTVWQKRFVQHLPAKVVITGTLWASGDFMALIINMFRKSHKFYHHKKYKYTLISEDESIAIIQIPALDYETDESTCPDVRTTAEVLKDKDNIEEYLWETNFQQRPTDPEALIFSYDKIRTYDRIPLTEDTSASYAVIDATRKTGKDYFSMPIFVKVYSEELYDCYLKDVLFTRTATKDMYDSIVRKIVEHHIVELVIESNVSSELKQNIEKLLKAMGVSFCTVKEKYNTEPKAIRITTESGNIKRRLVFPEKGKFPKNSEMGKFMDKFTLYNSAGRNETDDAPDSCALFTKEIIDGGIRNPIARPFKRPF